MNSDCFTIYESNQVTISREIMQCQGHPSIIKIKHKFKLNKKFSFQCVSEATVRKVVKSLPSDKATAGEIPVNVLKTTQCFPLSKVFEKIIYDQLYEYLENFLSELLCGFRKAHSTQHALFRLIQKWQAELDSGVMLAKF